MTTRTGELPTARLPTTAARGIMSAPGQAPPGSGVRAAGVLGGVVVLIALTVALMPVVAPKGPGNGAPIDVLMALSMLAGLVWIIRVRPVAHVPYVVPMAGLMVVGLAAAMAGEHTLAGGVAIAQEVFLLLWAAVIATACRTPRAVAVLLRVWVLSATAWAALLLFAVVSNRPAIAGMDGPGETRASLFFDHPNMAGNYFMVAIFILVAAGYPRRILFRAGAGLLLLTAMLLTGSNAAMLSLVIGLVLTGFLHIRARRGLVSATAFATVLVTALGAAWFLIALPLVTAAQNSDNPLLRYSIGRGARSADARGDLFLNQYELYESGNLLGIGPAATKVALGEAAAPVAKEAHNDYLATLVERGPLGAIALTGLIGAVAVRATRVTRRPLRGPLAEAVPVPAALAGACAAFAAFAVTHEVLHYRWLWTLLGVLAAVQLLARPRQRRSRSVPGAPRHAFHWSPARAR